MGLNFASQYIPMMIEQIDKHLDQLELDKPINLNLELGKISFKIITMILFGRDIQEKMEKLTYVSPHDHSTKSIDFEEFFSIYGNDEISAYLSPKHTFLPFLTSANLIEPYKSNARNKAELMEKLTDFCNKTEDTESVFSKLKELGEYTNDKIMDDIVLLLFAGFDTTSHAIGSTMYFLQKFPHTYSKLLSELEKHQITKYMDTNSSNLYEIYQTCDYLNNVIKEGLRMDPPAMSSLLYNTKENIQICNIPIPKNSVMAVNSIYPHYNSSEWHLPTKFIPERFEADSEYYYKPGTKDMRHPKAYIPFSFGERNCAGQTIAKLESKVLLSRILTKVEYKIDQDQIDNDYALFNLFSQMHINAKITKKL